MMVLMQKPENNITQIVMILSGPTVWARWSIVAMKVVICSKVGVSMRARFMGIFHDHDTSGSKSKKTLVEV